MRRMWVILLYTITTDANAETFSAVGAPVCGYGQYRQNDTCHSYEEEQTSPCQGRRVSGTSCLNKFITTASEIDNLYPFNAGFSVTGAAVNTYETMRNTNCLDTMDGYYKISTSQYSKPIDSQCAEGASEYKILNDCQNIDLSITDPSDTRSPLNPDNYMCGVLCDHGYGYKNNGLCYEYCKINNQVKYLYITREEKARTRIPLYKDVLTTPALHVRFTEDTVCHINLSTEPSSDALHIDFNNKIYYSTR